MQTKQDDRGIYYTRRNKIKLQKKNWQWETRNLPEKEFRVMIKMMIKELGIRMEALGKKL